MNKSNTKRAWVTKIKIVRVEGPYGIIVEKIETMPDDRPKASHGIHECGRHYNIFEDDDGFPQKRFYGKERK